MEQKSNKPLPFGSTNIRQGSQEYSVVKDSLFNSLGKAINNHTEKWNQTPFLTPFTESTQTEWKT